MDKDGPWEVHTLTIKDAILEDAGDYEVVASNRVGKTEMVGSLTVVTEEPSFPEPLKDVTTKLGATETFEVVVAGVPKPEVVWMKGDKELKKGKRMMFTEEELDAGQVKYKMTIKEIVMKDFGDVSRRLYILKVSPLRIRIFLLPRKPDQAFQKFRASKYVDPCFRTS